MSSYYSHGNIHSISRWMDAQSRYRTDKDSAVATSVKYAHDLGNRGDDASTG